MALLGVRNVKHEMTRTGLSMSNMAMKLYIDGETMDDNVLTRAWDACGYASRVVIMTCTLCTYYHVSELLLGDLWI